MKNILQPILFVLFAFVFFNYSAKACTEPPPQPEVEIICMNDTVLYLIFKEYNTFAETNGTCACGLNLTPSFGNADSIKMVYTNTMNEVPWFSFDANPNTSSGYNNLEAGNWAGFSSSILQSFPSGIVIDLIFCIRVHPNYPNCNAMLSDINDYILGQENLIGTSGADNEGSPQPGHTNIVSANPMVISVPTLSEWGILVLFLFLLTVGTVVLTQQSQSRLSMASTLQIPIKTPLFNAQLFQNLVLKSLLLILIIITFISYVENGLFIRNILGTILSVLIITYWLHFIQLNYQQENS